MEGLRRGLEADHGEGVLRLTEAEQEELAVIDMELGGLTPQRIMADANLYKQATRREELLAKVEQAGEEDEKKMDAARIEHGL